MWQYERAMFNGFMVHRGTAAKGEIQTLRAQDAYERARAWNQLYFVKGELRYIGKPPGVDTFPIKAPCTNEGVPHYTKPGDYVLQASEDTQFWCVQSDPPFQRLESQRHDIAAETVYTLPAGRLAILVKGVAWVGTEPVHAGQLLCDPDRPIDIASVSPLTLFEVWRA